TAKLKKKNTEKVHISFGFGKFINKCYTQYIGYRCEMIDQNSTLKSSESTEEKDIENRHIPGITACVVAVFIVVLAIILIRRIERKMRVMDQKQQTWFESLPTHKWFESLPTTKMVGITTNNENNLNHFHKNNL
ncbi:hypothetical protein AM593_05761, partial [Mytilus galloprovincialis]